MDNTAVRDELIEKLEQRTAKVVVLGLGYVGLPLAAILAEAGYQVVGVDPEAGKVDLLCRGESYIPDIPSEQVERLVQSGRLSATTDFSVIREADAVSICVPTPLRKTGDPDLSFILSAAEEVARYVHPGMVVVLESTTYPGTTRELLLPELTEHNDLIIGENFFLAFSPERVDPGRKDWTTYNTPKVIGGISQNCSEVASKFYGQALQSVVPVSSAEVAEMAKLLENTFRMINIGLVNEMAMMCDKLGVDVWEVIDAAATKPFGFMKFTPGPGLGGHCIPIDPLYLSWKLRSLKYNARFIELASEINTGMPRYVVSIIQDALNDNGKALKGSKILVMGVAYKPDVDDMRESPAVDVIGLIKQKGGEVMYFDPYVPVLKEEDYVLESVSNSRGDLMEAVEGVDAVVIITNHSVFDYTEILEKAALIVDTRNALGTVGRDHPKVVRL
jgi:UDP-N-acetyl-D-glucosamine dehydrogenase